MRHQYSESGPSEPPLAAVRTPSYLFHHFDQSRKKMTQQPTSECTLIIRLDFVAIYEIISSSSLKF